MSSLSAIILGKNTVSNAADIAQTRPHYKEREPIDDTIDRYLEQLECTIEAISRFSATVDVKWIPKIIGKDARKIPLSEETVDLVVFSPPYINALDYPRSHKFAIWWLDGLLFPEGAAAYSAYARRYIGTERVLKDEYEERAQVRFGVQSVDNVVQAVYRRNRRKGGVVHRYFDDMRCVLEETLRVLKKGRHLVLIVGENVVCGIDVNTPDLLGDLAEHINHLSGTRLRVIERFDRRIDQIKRKFPVNRGPNAPGMKREIVLVLRRE